MTQYFFYFFNHLFFKGFSDFPTFLQPYIEAMICANSEDAEVPIQWCGEFIENEKYPISYIDIDIITKFSSTRDLYKLLDEFHIKHLRIDAESVSFLVVCFENLCTSIVTAQTYGYRFSSITTLANLATLLNLVELDTGHTENLKNILTKLFYDKQATQVLFSLQCPDFRNVLRALSALCKSLPHSTDTEIVRNIVMARGFFEYAVNVSFSQLRSLILSFILKQDAQEVQNELQGIIESFDNFSYKVILLRLFYSKIINQAIKKYYSEMLLSQFLQLETGAVYDFILSGWLAPTQETLGVFLNNILEMHRNKMDGFQSYPDPIERGLECAYILFISDILTDISPLKEMASERPHLQFLLDPNTFDYSQVDFTNYMWLNFARKKEYMPYFVTHKDVIAPKIKERIEKNLASKDEKKILYRFLVDDNEIWKI